MRQLVVGARYIVPLPYREITKNHHVRDDIPDSGILQESFPHLLFPKLRQSSPSVMFLAIALCFTG